MATVAYNATTASNSTAFGNQRKIDRCQNGVLWAVWPSPGTTGNLGVSAFTAFSTDNGATWTSSGAPGESASYYGVDGSFFIDIDDYAHWVYRDSANTIGYTRGTPNAARNGYAWSTAITLASSSAYDIPDVVAFRDPAGSGGWIAHAVWGNSGGGTTAVQWAKLAITSAGAVTVSTPTSPGFGTYTSSIQSCPSIDFRHTGDGKTVAGGSPDLFVTATGGPNNGIRFVKGTYSAGAWTWGPDRVIDSTRYANGTQVSGMFDGTRVVIAGQLQASNDQDVVIYERDAADTTTTTRVLFTSVTALANGNTANGLSCGAAGYDTAGNVYLFGASNGNSPFNLGWYKWTRATATTSARTVAVSSLSGNSPYVSARRSNTGNRLDYVFTNSSTSPYAVLSGSVALDSPPNAPTLNSPVGNAAVDYTQPIPLAWAFSDPDAGDSQSKADVQWRVSGGSTWTSIAGAATTATTYSFPANTWTSQTTIEWQVRTYDSVGAVGPWSTSGFFVATPPTPAPTITAPASGATIGATTYTVTWSEANQSGYEVRTVADASGSPVVGTVYSDTQNTADTSTRSLSVPFPTNNLTEHVQVRCLYQGLWSPWADVRVTVSFTPPAVPTVVLTPVATSSTGPSDSLQVTVNNPAPGSGQPAVTSYDVLVDDMVNGTGLRRVAAAVPAGQAWTYAWPRSGYDYSGGKVQVTCYAANGTTSTATS